MQSVKIYHEPSDVDSRIASLGITKSDILQVVQQSVLARNEAVLSDPRNAPGLLAYIYGTRAIRMALLPKGWEIDRTDNIEGTRNKETGVKIMFQNTDSAADLERSPKAISNKGSASERMVATSAYLFHEMEEEDRKFANSSVWFVCVAVTDTGITAELSCPKSIENSQFSEFSERIFVVNPGEFDDFNLSSYDDDEPQNIDVTITRKN